jgi:hypothetical protein
MDNNPLKNIIMFEIWRKPGLEVFPRKAVIFGQRVDVDHSASDKGMKSIMQIH